MNSKNILLSIIILCSSLIFGFSAYAELKNPDLPDRKGVKAGPLIMHAAYKSNVQFDTNVFLQDKNPQFDTITLVNPSVGIELPLGKHRFSADYDIGINFFGHNPHQNYADQRLRTLAEIKLTDYLITIEDTFKDFSSRSGSEDTNRIKQMTNEFKTAIEAKFDQLLFSLGYIFGIQNYKSKEIIYESMTYRDKNRFTNTLEGAVKYKFLPKTYAVVVGSLGVLNYFSNLSSDSFFGEVLGGLEGRPKKDLTIDLKGGLRYQHYYRSDLTSSNDFVGFVANGGINYDITNKDTVSLRLERAIYESTYDNMNYYTVNSITLGYTRQLMKNLTFKVAGGYQFNHYPSATVVDGVTAKRYDNFYFANCSLHYAINKWGAIEVKYEFVDRSSKFSDFDYIDHLVVIQGTVGF